MLTQIYVTIWHHKAIMSWNYLCKKTTAQVDYLHRGKLIQSYGWCSIWAETTSWTRNGENYFRKHKNLSTFPISPDSEIVFTIDILPQGGICNIMGCPMSSKHLISPANLPIPTKILKPKKYMMCSLTIESEIIPWITCLTELFLYSSQAASLFLLITVETPPHVWHVYKPQS